MSLPGKFDSGDSPAVGTESVSKTTDAAGYEVVVDTKGTLLWDDQTGAEKPFLIITSTQGSKAYLEYLDGLYISWIACGAEQIDLARAVGICEAV